MPPPGRPPLSAGCSRSPRHIRDLKANEVFLKLQQQLTDIEDLLASARNYYNAVVRRYNNAISVFPGRLLAGHRFTRAEFFQADAADREGPPKVTT